MPTFQVNGSAVVAKPWSRMPHQGRYDPVSVRINGARAEAQLTEGGAPIRKYSYITVRGQVYYFKGHVEASCLGSVATSQSRSRTFPRGRRLPFPFLSNMPPNNALERSGRHRGGPVLTLNGVFAKAKSAPWRAAQLGR